MFRRHPVLLFALLIGLATSAARADDARRLELAKELMAQVHTDESLRMSLPLMIAQMRRSLAQQGQKDEQATVFIAR